VDISFSSRLGLGVGGNIIVCFGQEADRDRGKRRKQRRTEPQARVCRSPAQAQQARVLFSRLVLPIIPAFVSHGTEGKAERLLKTLDFMFHNKHRAPEVV